MTGYTAKKAIESAVEKAKSRSSKDKLSDIDIHGIADQRQKYIATIGSGKEAYRKVLDKLSPKSSIWTAITEDSQKTVEILKELVKKLEAEDPKSSIDLIKKLNTKGSALYQSAYDAYYLKSTATMSYIRELENNITFKVGDRTLKDIECDLVAINREFDKVAVLKNKVDKSYDELVVTTEPIILGTKGNEVDLGRMIISLKLKEDRGSKVTAEKPNIAQGYYHPHIDTVGNLCSGDYANYLVKLRQTNHLFDYFVAIRQILRTYNSDSPYLDLEEWLDKLTCGCCGTDNIDKSTSTDCDYCDADLCDKCWKTCSVCDFTNCKKCMPGTSHRCKKCREAGKTK